MPPKMPIIYSPRGIIDQSYLMTVFRTRIRHGHDMLNFIIRTHRAPPSQAPKIIAAPASSLACAGAGPLPPLVERDTLRAMQLRLTPNKPSPACDHV